MNHTHMGPDPLKCTECGYPESKHGDNAVCDCCTQTGNLQPYLLGNSQALLTRDCIERERAILETQIKINDEIRSHRVQQFGVPADGESRVLQYNAITRPYEHLISEVRRIDESLHLSSDIFTAKTIPIEDIRKAIWANESIAADKKFFEFVSECKRRINTLQTVIFDLDKKKIEAYSEQKAWHVAMNDFANKLQREEREQLKIQDIHYDVKVPKTVTVKAIRTNPKKATVTELRKAVGELNTECNSQISEMIVNMTMVAKNWTLDQAINHFRRSLKEGKSEQS